MSRNGIELKTDYGKQDAASILGTTPLKIVGLMTHYPTEDTDDILRQLARFEQDTAWLKANGLPPGPLTRHTANTFATLHHPQTRLDMVRVGGALYGDTSADFLARFRPTITLKSRVAAVNISRRTRRWPADCTYRLRPANPGWPISPMVIPTVIAAACPSANQPDFANEERTIPRC